MNQLTKQKNKFEVLKELNEQLKEVPQFRPNWLSIEKITEQMKSFIKIQFPELKDDVNGVEKPKMVTFGGRHPDEASLVSIDNDHIRTYVNNITSIAEAALMTENIDNYSSINTTENHTYLILQICKRFDSSANVLKKRKYKKGGKKRTPLLMKDEYDVQYLLLSLLKPFFDDVRPEEPTPSNAGSSSRMDILLKKEKTVIEIKMTRKTLGNKELKSQLNDDIGDYIGHNDCNHIIYFIYDPLGKIDNQKGFINDLSAQITRETKANTKRIKVDVVVSPERN